MTSLAYNHGSTTIGDLSCTYDANGRPTSVGGSLALVYLPSVYYRGSNVYNADNELITDNTASGQGPTLTYDALGRRVSKTVDGNTSKFLYDGLNPVRELDGSGAVVANMLTGLNTDEYFTRTEPACCGPLSYLTDALGSTVALADRNGVIQDQYQYEPFGNTYPTTYNNTSTNPYQFTGRENDSLSPCTSTAAAITTQPSRGSSPRTRSICLASNLVFTLMLTTTRLAQSTHQAGPRSISTRLIKS